MQDALDPEMLLFTDLEGERGQLQDIIDEGLDGGYEARIPALVQLMAQGEPYHRLLACMMLASWGVAEGLETLTAWASHPGAAPWAGDPVSFNRISGADSAFELLADALKTSFYADETPTLRALQVAAARALLGLYATHDFGRTLALALLRDRSVAAAVEGEIKVAVEASMAALERGVPVGFDLPFQVASLLFALARLDDARAATIADQLLAKFPQHSRMLRELAHAMAEGSGPATLALLERLKAMASPAIEQEVASALKRRSAPPASS